MGAAVISAALVVLLGGFGVGGGDEGPQITGSGKSIVFTLRWVMETLRPDARVNGAAPA